MQCLESGFASSARGGVVLSIEPMTEGDTPLIRLQARLELVAGFDDVEIDAEARWPV
jgi:hypothetical protein